MKTLIAVSVVAVMAMTSGAQAGGFFTKKITNTKILSNITGVVSGVNVQGVNVLNGNTIAVGNNSNILSGIGNGSANNLLGGGVLNNLLSGNGILGIGGQNTRY